MRGALPSATLGPEVSEATEGVDKSLSSHPLTVKEQISVFFSPSLPHREGREGSSSLLNPMLIYLPIQRIACYA